ncbi:MAG: hypothetical protein ACE5JS_05880 [Nitrospinota bacterium]
MVVDRHPEEDERAGPAGISSWTGHGSSHGFGPHSDIEVQAMKSTLIAILATLALSGCVGPAFQSVSRTPTGVQGSRAEECVVELEDGTQVVDRSCAYRRDLLDGFIRRNVLSFSSQHGSGV